jgi:hypothetical protein
MAQDITRFDIRLDLNDDLFFSTSGDILLSPSDEQHIQDCINSGPCWWKVYPDAGVNIGVYQNGSFDKQSLQKLIRLQLQADGYNASPTLHYSSDGQLTIDPGINL